MIDAKARQLGFNEMMSQITEPIRHSGLRVWETSELVDIRYDETCICFLVAWAARSSQTLARALTALTKASRRSKLEP